MLRWGWQVASGIPADLIDEVYDRAIERVPELASEVAGRMLRPDGTTFGDETLTRGERIQRFLDYAERGVLDALRTVKPELLERLVKQYLEDIRSGPFEQ
jgi:hypothetical protein